MRKILYILLSFIAVSVSAQIEQPRIKFDQVIKDSTGSGRIVISSLTDSNMIYSADFYINTVDSLLILFGDTVQAGSAVDAAQVRDIIFATIDAGLGVEIDTSSQLGILTIQSLSVEDSVYNGTGNLIAKGTPLYVVGIQGNYWSVEPAQANDSTKMPVVAIAGKDIAAGQQGLGLLKGHIKGVDTDLFEAGDEIWVGATGGYTNVRPKGEDVLVQKLGTVVKANSNGSGIINLGEVQYNLNPNNIFIGGADSLQTTANLPTVLSDSLNNYVTIAGTETITGAKTFSTGIVVNEDGNNLDTRFEGGIDANLLFLDASANRVGIGTSSPEANLDIIPPITNLANYQFRIKDVGSNGFFGISDGASGAAYIGDIRGFGDNIDDFGLIFTGGPNSDHDIGTADRAAIIFEAAEYDSTTNTITAVENTHLFNFRNYGSSKMFIQNDGDVGIGTIGPSYKLHVNGSVAGVGAYNNLSDVNWKKNIQDITYGIDKILQLKPITFNWLNEDYGDRINIGFIAQEVEEIIPNMVTTAEDGTKSLAITDLIPVLTKAIQEQQVIIESQASEIEQLKSQIQLILSEIEQIKNN